MTDIIVIGGGLAGSEAAWQAAQNGAKVDLYEMRPVQKTDAHHSDGLAELVCSNSFRSDDYLNNAVGLLHEEMRRCDSLIMAAAEKHKVPAGGALAVDRDLFSQEVTQCLESHKNITIKRTEITEIPTADQIKSVIIASGPLTSASLSDEIAKLTDKEYLAFFDAIAPIIYTETIDFSKAWYQSRYDKEGPAGTGKDYINCALSKEQYEDFITDLITSEKGDFKEWEKNTPYFDGCLPIEVMAERGPETLRFGPMKPVGLTNPNQAERPYAVIQLRQDNALATLYNIVGFQTKMTYSEQKRVFRKIPGLENAEFARLGGLHRNTFLNSPTMLDSLLRLKSHPHIRFAGQITGVEGYVESAAMGLLAGRFSAFENLHKSVITPPQTTALGCLIHHITGGAEATSFQPMNINFGLFPPLEGKMPRGRKGRKERRPAMAERALADLENWQNTEH